MEHLKTYLFLNNFLIIFPIFQYVILTILQYVESNYFIFFWTNMDYIGVILFLGIKMF